MPLFFSVFSSAFYSVVLQTWVFNNCFLKTNIDWGKITYIHIYIFYIIKCLSLSLFIVFFFQSFVWAYYNASGIIWIDLSVLWSHFLLYDRFIEWISKTIIILIGMRAFAIISIKCKMRVAGGQRAVCTSRQRSGENRRDDDTGRDCGRRSRFQRVGERVRGPRQRPRVGQSVAADRRPRVCGQTQTVR